MEADCARVSRPTRGGAPEGAPRTAAMTSRDAWCVLVRAAKPGQRIFVSAVKVAREWL